MIRTLADLPRFVTEADIRSQDLRAADSPTRRYEFGFAAVIGEVHVPPGGNLRTSRRYDWTPCYRHPDMPPMYEFEFDEDTQRGRWIVSDTASRATNVAESRAYESALIYPAVPAGTPVIMWCSWICSGGPPVLLGGVPGGGGERPVCNITYWFYHWMDPDHWICTDLPDP